MIGVIGLSTVQIVERIEYAHDVGFRTFQISLPSWGPVNDGELLRFFADACGPFPDSRFLNYNLPRTKRVLTGRDYARIIAEVPNLVATKTTGGGIAGAEELIATPVSSSTSWARAISRTARCSASARCWRLMPSSSPRMTFALFEAGRTRDAGELMRLQHAFQAMGTGPVGAARSRGRTWTAPTTRCWSSSGCCPSSRSACCRRTGLHRGRLPGVPRVPPGRVRRLARTDRGDRLGVTAAPGSLPTVAPATIEALQGARCGHDLQRAQGPRAGRARVVLRARSCAACSRTWARWSATR